MEFARINPKELSLEHIFFCAHFSFLPLKFQFASQAIFWTNAIFLYTPPGFLAEANKQSSPQAPILKGVQMCKLTWWSRQPTYCVMVKCLLRARLVWGFAGAAKSLRHGYHSENLGDSLPSPPLPSRLLMFGKLFVSGQGGIRGTLCSGLFPPAGSW